MNADEIDRVIRRLTAAWPDKKLPDDTLVLWNEELEPLTFGAAWGAAVRITRVAKFFPHLSEFLTTYSEAKVRMTDASTARADCPAVGCDHGWMFVRGDGNVPTVRPCDRCNPLARRAS